jgi:hypothetical protein
MSVPSTQTNYALLDQEMSNIFRADQQTRDSLTVGVEIAKCVNRYGHTLQQIESRLRDKHCWSFLIARKRNSSHGPNLRFMLAGVNKTYNLFISTHKPDIAMQELLQESSSYQENFAKLADTGFIMYDNSKPVTQQFRSGTLQVNNEFFAKSKPTKKD